MYAPNYIDLQLFDSKVFKSKLEGTQTVMSVFRETLKQGHELLKSRFKTTLNAVDYVTQRTWLIDQVLLHAWQRHHWNSEIALIAVGGYGRGELHPASDIDLMILLKEPLDETTQHQIEDFVTLLWDVRLEVGHSVRTLLECWQEIAKDVSVVTNLLESRLLVGSETLFKEIQSYLAPGRIWSTKRFFAFKIEEQIRRHLKYHDTAYNLEPNVKEGPGGLRDVQMIGWVAKYHFGATTLHDLVQYHFLTEEEYQILIACQENIWKIRCFLHLLSGRHEDRLLFDYQRTLASLLNYEDDSARLGVEKLMRRYYRTVKEISGLNDMLLQLFQEVILYGDNVPAIVYPLNKRFQVRNDFIEVTYDKVFQHYPFALLEIFLLIQQYPEIRGVRASTIRLIRQYNNLIDEAFRKDLRARSLFFEIIRQPRGITQALRQMNHFDVLGAYIRSFGKIIGQMQYDLFHVYTVDQHTIFVVRNLRRFAIPKYYHEFPLCSEVMASLPKPELLYLAGLFHDIAKGRGEDHSEVGESEALDFCQGHGLSDYDARFVAWLVRNHLLMSMTAQRQDISDPDIINAFAKRVGENVRLDYLYLLTVADIRATNPNLWNGWKASLLVELYHRTQQALQRGLEDTLSRRVHVQTIQSEALMLLNQQDYDCIMALWKDLGEDYFLYALPQDIAYETQAVLNHDNPNVPLVLERRRRGSSEFIMYARDRDYLFADTTRFLEQQSLTIVDAYIIPTQGECTISGYTVLEENGTEIDSGLRIEGILQGLKQTLLRDTGSPLYPVKRRMPRQLKYFAVPTRITFTQDRSNNRTVLEVVTADRPGILSRIAQAFAICQVRIKKAKIATLGSRVEDIFFITDYQNEALHSAEQLDCLREELYALLNTET
ncbi:MAG: [protein-PII] uridylyltransferase [Beggiatoa sp. IS2]|nr:MAG: [protein-PII] uridylyltransferase [Beggiatoa sp. IS2]